MRIWKTEFLNALVLKEMTSRKNYWIFFVINSVVLGLILSILIYLQGISNDSNIQLAPIYSSVSLVFAIPAFSAGWRRLRDAGFPGALVLIPFLGFIFTLMPSKDIS